MIALSTKEMYAVDKYMIEKKGIPSVVLMENAAFAVTSECIKHEYDCIYIFCGKGNNGKDGLAVARQLKVRSINAVEINLEKITDITELESIFNKITKHDAIVDAILGIGLDREVSGLYKDVIDRINASSAYIYAVDIPSGIEGNFGKIMGVCVRAYQTITFQYPKLSHFLYPSRDFVGKLTLAKIGLDDGCDVLEHPKIEVLLSNVWGISLKKRNSNSHKGFFGHALIFCGGKGYTGAGKLCVSGALSAGAGIVYAAVPDSLYNIYADAFISNVILPIKDSGGRFDNISFETLDSLLQNKNAVCIGCGMGDNENMLPTISCLLSNFDIPKLFDADALNVISRNVEVLKNSAGDVVLTPHPKEFSRLSGLSVAEILDNPVKYAADFAKKYSLTLLLKGATTVVASKHGEVCLVCAGTPGMAKGGSGDLLSGVISSFLAQGYDPYTACKLGAYICGTAGEAAAAKHGEFSMTPVHTLEEIRI